MRKFSTSLGLTVIVTFALTWLLAGCNQQPPAPAVPVNLALPPSNQGFARATEPIPFTFPEDHGPHPEYQTEWWYFTGNLASDIGERFGYQLTFFRRALLPPSELPERQSNWATGQVYMAHFALTDVERQQYHSFERLARGAAGISGAQSPPFQVWLEDWRVEETAPNTYSLTASQDGIAINLLLFDTKGPILQGDQGYSQKGPAPGQASYYYSLTRLTSNGTVQSDGQSYTVSGESWMDHEFSTSALSAGQVGWDWFSIQLDDNSELMFFQIRRADGSIDPYSSGTFITGDGTTTPLALEDFSIEVTDTWISPHTGANYPAGWRLEIPSLSISLVIRPLAADQEFSGSYAYWEGAVEVSGEGGDLNGYGYVELTGYTRSMGGEF